MGSASGSGGGGFNIGWVPATDGYGALSSMLAVSAGGGGAPASARRRRRPGGTRDSPEPASTPPQQSAEARGPQRPAGQVGTPPQRAHYAGMSVWPVIRDGILLRVAGYLRQRREGRSG